MTVPKNYVRLTSKYLSCPECGSKDITTFVDKVEWGQKETIYVPIRKCDKCDFKWTDWVAEEIFEKQIEEMRKSKKEIEEFKLDPKSCFYKNCKCQRKRGAKICLECPFRKYIERKER